MASRRKKPPADTPYPKKFRMKLEKMAAARKERAVDQDLDTLAEEAMRTLVREFLPKNRVHLLHGVGEPEKFRLTLKYQIDPPPRVAVLGVIPPWETETPPS